MNTREAGEIIRNSISTIDVGKRLGLNVDMHNRCSCPFHNGKDRNMRLYDGNRGFYCFVCHKSGDCISLASCVAGCSYGDAVWLINDEFNLGLRDEWKRPSIWQRNIRNNINRERS